MANEALKKFSEELKAERESKNISLQQVANKTKIDIKFLRAIEEAKFDILPDIYIRAFIKEYALVLDLKVNEVINKFDFVMHGKVEEKQEEKPLAEEKEKKKIHEKPTGVESIVKEQPQAANTSESKKKRFDYNYLIGAASAFVVLILLYFLFVKESSPEIITDQNYSNSVDEEKPAFEIDSVKTEKNDSVAIANDSLKLTVSISQRVWVKILADNKVLQMGMVDANSVLNYNAFKEFRVVVGNAGYVKLSFNGKPVQNVGKPGELRNIIINADTVKAYTLSTPVKNENKSPTKN
jgi:cytoskeleton protein RodZ